MKLHQLVPALLLAVPLPTGAAYAEPAPPYGPNCTVDDCIRLCPAGDMNFHIVVRDVAGIPIAGSNVVVEICGTGLIDCPPGALPCFEYPGVVALATTNAAGVAELALQVGGSISVPPYQAPAAVSADGVHIKYVRIVSSPDQNGDGAVNATDQAIMAAKIGGPYDPTADLNCGGTLGADDAGLLNAHLGHACSAVVPMAPRSWGTVKTIYR